MEISVPLEVGEIATVESCSDEAFGVVRYCREVAANRFQAGVEIFHVMPKEEPVKRSWTDRLLNIAGT